MARQSGWGGTGAASGTPQALQNRLSAGFAVWHAGQGTASNWPQPVQNRASVGFVRWQCGHVIMLPPFYDPRIPISGSWDTRKREGRREE